MKKILLSLILLFIFIIAHSQSGAIINIQVSQRTDGSGLADVFFDLIGEANGYNILLEVSFDGGNNYTPVAGNFLEGNTGPVSPGEGNQITWNGHESFPDTLIYPVKSWIAGTALLLFHGVNLTILTLNLAVPQGSKIFLSNTACGGRILFLKNGNK